MLWLILAPAALAQNVWDGPWGGAVGGSSGGGGGAGTERLWSVSAVPYDGSTDSTSWEQGDDTSAFTVGSTYSSGFGALDTDDGWLTMGTAVSPARFYIDLPDGEEMSITSCTAGRESSIPVSGFSAPGQPLIGDFNGPSSTSYRFAYGYTNTNGTIAQEWRVSSELPGWSLRYNTGINAGFDLFNCWRVAVNSAGTTMYFSASWDGRFWRPLYSWTVASITEFDWSPGASGWPASNEGAWTMMARVRTGSGVATSNAPEGIAVMAAAWSE